MKTVETAKGKKKVRVIKKADAGKFTEINGNVSSLLSEVYGKEGFNRTTLGSGLVHFSHNEFEVGDVTSISMEHNKDSDIIIKYSSTNKKILIRLERLFRTS